MTEKHKSDFVGLEQEEVIQDLFASLQNFTDDSFVVFRGFEEKSVKLQNIQKLIHNEFDIIAV